MTRGFWALVVVGVLWFLVWWGERVAWMRRVARERDRIGREITAGKLREEMERVAPQGRSFKEIRRSVHRRWNPNITDKELEDIINGRTSERKES